MFSRKIVRSSSAWHLVLIVTALGCRFDPGPPATTGGLPPGARSGGTAGFNAGPSLFVDPSLPAQTPSQFGGAPGPDATPSVVYPLAGSMHPINLGDITFQWSQGKPRNTVFRIEVTAPSASYDFFVPCTRAQCIYQMPSQAWLAMASAARGQTVTFTVAGSDGRGGPVSTSAPITISFSPEAVRGGLYYWSTRLRGVYRLTFGARKALPYIQPSSPTNPAACAGCHSVSRDGRRIAFTAVPAAEGAFGGLAVAPTDDPGRRTVDPRRGVTDSSVPALSPDGSRVAVVLDSGYAASGAKAFIIRETDGGAEINRLGVGHPFLGPNRFATFPEWSPDGQSIAITVGTTAPPRANYGATALLTSDIAILPYNDGALGPATVLVPASGGEYHFYPSWSPDGKWLVFATAKMGGPTEDDKSPANRTARLRLVEVATGRVYELGAATQGSSSTSTWPKFTPFAQQSGDLLFIAYSTKIDYGYVLQQQSLKDGQTPAGSPPGWKHPQIWMAAISLANLRAGQDPSYAPIWLPYQETTQDNHIPYWTEVITCQGNVDQAGCNDDEICTPEGTCASVVP
jgi:WD40-like Beta Propeller Repeat